MTFFLLISVLILQRIFELVLSKRNERRLRAQGAIESGKSHYPVIVALHVAFFISLVVEVIALDRTSARWWWVPFAFFLIAQILRYWSIATLGRRWNTRILVLPGAAPITIGPYRYFRHPNYVAVAIELLSIPLIFQAYFTAIVFTLLNAIVMAVRITAEERALHR